MPNVKEAQGDRLSGNSGRLRSSLGSVVIKKGASAPFLIDENLVGVVGVGESHVAIANDQYGECDE